MFCAFINNALRKSEAEASLKVSWVSACTFRYLHSVVHTFMIMYDTTHAFILVAWWLVRLLFLYDTFVDSFLCEMGHSDTFSKWIIHKCSMIFIMHVYLAKACTHPYLRTCVFTPLYLERDSIVYKHDKTYSSTYVPWWFMYAFIFEASHVDYIILVSNRTLSYRWQRMIDMWYRTQIFWQCFQFICGTYLSFCIAHTFACLYTYTYM